MNQSSRSVALYLILTFTSGVAVGAFGFWTYTARTVAVERDRRPSPQEFRHRYMEEMQARLQLNPEQTQKLTSILDASELLFRQIADKRRPEYEAIQHNQREQVRAILTDQQKIEYEKFLTERENRRKAKGRGKGPGFGPRDH